MGERFCQTRPQEEALEILKCLQEWSFKIVGGVMEVIHQNQDIRNMRCQNGNAKNRSSSDSA
jgi:hypothetical protein